MTRLLMPFYIVHEFDLKNWPKADLDRIDIPH